MYILEVYVTHSNLNLDHPFTYLSLEKVEAFKRVKIRFNRQVLVGFVTSFSYTEADYQSLCKEFGFKLAYIMEVIDKEPILSLELYSLAKWMAKVTVSPFVSCLNVMLPKTLKTTTSVLKVVKDNYIHKKPIDNQVLTKRQQEVYDLLKDGMTYKEARMISSSILAKLIDFGLIEKYEDLKKDKHIKVDKQSFKTLTASQKAAYDSIINTNLMVSLLFGVTGSGKTEVYLHLAQYYLSLNKQVLILVPEISLTPQMIKRVLERFDRVGIYHSYLSDQRRHREYQRVLNKEVDIVIGTRSSIFLPFDNLGLIIIDEEHDHSYSQDNVPCYNAKDVAFKRAKDFNAKVLLASATPSLLSFKRSLEGKYNLTKLENRINLSLPDIKMVDLNKALQNKEDPILSNTLKEAIDKTLKRNKQIIILLNRRGYAPIIKCADCNEVLMCNDCDVALSYHNDTNNLKCNVCGKTYPLKRECPNCHSKNLVSYGFGTKKVVESLQDNFNNARIIRMDADSTTASDSHFKILEAFGRHEYDIMVGTQMLAKGLDYPDVTLVGILNADSSLLRDDFNANETTFDLLMQASGRSGRSKDEGEVIIQAFNPNHYVLNAILKQNYQAFYNQEMNYRQKAKLPPFIHLVAVYLSDDNYQNLNKATTFVYHFIKDHGLKAFEPYDLTKLKTRHRKRIIINDDDYLKVLNVLNNLKHLYRNQKFTSSLKVDVDPLYLE